MPLPARPQLQGAVPPFDRLPPTAEMLASHICNEMATRLPGPRVKVARVEVWESESSCAIYQP
jgi:hypothetical protein